MGYKLAYVGCVGYSKTACLLVFVFSHHTTETWKITNADAKNDANS